MIKRRLFLSLIVVLAVLLATTQPISATKGTGVLYVYRDSDYSELVDTDDKGFYEVNPGQTVYIRIQGIKEPFTYVIVRVSYQDLMGEATILGNFSVLIDSSGEKYVGDPENPIVWTVPDEAVPCFTYVVQYKDGLDKSSTYIACNPGVSRPAHLHVVPEYPLGTIGAISILFASFGIYYLFKSRKAILAPKF